MSEPNIAQQEPYRVDVQEGERYFWCACGRSSNQPFCDGSHEGTDFTPLRYDAEESKPVFFCGCKHTGNSPLCDGTHNNL